MSQSEIAPNATVKSARASLAVSTINQAEQPSEDRLREVFPQLEKQARGLGRADEADVYRLLYGVFSMQLQDDTHDEPFGPLLVTHTGRTPIPSDLVAADLDILQDLLYSSRNPSATARLADVLWQHRRNGDFAKKAIESYIAATARALRLDDGSWLKGRTYLIRAAQLVAVTRNSTAKKELTELIEASAMFDEPEPSNYKRVLIFEAAAKTGFVDTPAGWMEISSDFADEAQEAGAFEKAQSYWDLAIEFGRLAKDRESRARFLKRKADGYVEAARTRNHEGNSALVIRECFSKAIEACRAAGGSRALVDQLHAEMNAVQQRALGEMQAFEIPFDGTDLIELGTKVARAASLKEALSGVAELARPFSVQEQRKRAEAEINDNLLSALFSAVHYTRKGRVAAIRPSVLEGTDEERELVTVSNMIQAIVLETNAACISYLEAARKVLNHRCPSDIYELRDLVFNNPLVPEGRERLFYDGVLYGIRGDWTNCAHILTPQIEHSIRSYMECTGRLVTFLDKDTTQNDLDLNTLLRSPQLLELLDEDVVFTWRALLIDKVGFNLRNEVAHGLREDFGPVPVNFLWAFTLYYLHLGRRAFLCWKAQTDSGDV